MRRLVPAALALSLFSPLPAIADIGVAPDFDAFVVSGDDRNPPERSPGTTGSTEPEPTTTTQNPQCGLGGLVTCAEPAYCDDGSAMVVTSLVAASGNLVSQTNNCPAEGEPAAEQPEVTPGLVAQALRRLDLPAAELEIQPPGGRTLVNFETNFFTEQGELSRTVRLLGREVELRIWPAEFVWRYGDGTVERTTGPGAAYPALDITHTYLRTGRVRPSLDVTYAAEFRVGSGSWRAVAGTVTIPGDAHELEVVPARPVLVGH